MVAFSIEAWKARLHNYLYLIEFFFWIKIAVIEDFVPWYIENLSLANDCAIPKTFVFKASSTRYLLFLPASTNFVIISAVITG